MQFKEGKFRIRIWAGSAVESGWYYCC